MSQGRLWEETEDERDKEAWLSCDLSIAQTS